MIARVVLALFALMGFVSAEVPQFSATDDYDELNLNIRMLKNHSAGNDTAMSVVSVDVTMTIAGLTSVDDITADHKTAMVGGFVTVVGAPATTSNTKVAKIVAGRRQLSADKRQLSGLTVVVTFETTVASTAAAGLSSALAADSFGTALETALSAGEFKVGDGVSGVSAAAPTTTEKATTTEEESTEEEAASPTPAPAAESTSNAAMMSANIVLVAVAALSSFF